MDANKTDTSDLDRFLQKTAGAISTRQSDRREMTGRVGLTGEAPAPDESASITFTEEEEQERQNLRQLCESMRGHDHYSILGVERSASLVRIRDAYYRLAHAHHPDRYLRPHLESIHRELEHMFAAIADAYSVLSDKDKREEYDRELNARMAGRSNEHGMDKQASARDAYLRGRAEMESKNIFEAIGMFEQATKLDPTRGEYFYYLGSCQARNPRWKKKAEENLLKSLDLNPGSTECYLALARLYKRGGLEKRSREMYREAIRWDPANAEAMEALKKEGEEAGGGLLGSLFKKT